MDSRAMDTQTGRPILGDVWRGRNAWARTLTKPLQWCDFDAVTCDLIAGVGYYYNSVSLSSFCLGW